MKEEKLTKYGLMPPLSRIEKPQKMKKRCKHTYLPYGNWKGKQQCKKCMKVRNEPVS